MPTLEFTDQQIQQLTTMLANTKEWPWVVTNPLLVTITQQMQPPPQVAPYKGNSDKRLNNERRVSDQS
jgi:hypothetical protein